MEKYPAVELKVITGNHEDLYNGLVSDRIDLSFHDQRRVFHDDYENVILTETVCYVELATHSPLARLDSISVKELKNSLFGKVCLMLFYTLELYISYFYTRNIHF